MALKPWTMSFKETNPDEVKLHEILQLKTSPMAFAKDILIDILVRGKTLETTIPTISNTVEQQNDKDELSDIFGLD